ncbi:MAG: hypothetical protein ACJ78Q_08390, partial [Chloroflexia bacterium]
MDIRDRVMGDQPHDFLHKIAGIVPGFDGYMDRERRRDADKLLRTYLAHQYSAQLDRLKRVQQSLLRSGQLTGISEVDRLTGVLQRFIDRLSTATYGYSGLFDPVKVEAQDLDQLYAFDMALTSGVDEVSSAVGGLETGLTAESAKTDVPAALSHLSSVLDDLNLRLNQRGDLLTSGRGLPADQYNSLVNSMSAPASTPSATPDMTGAPATAGMAGAATATPPPTAAPSTAAPPQYASGTPSTGAPTVNTSGGESARYSGAYPDYPGGMSTGNTTQGVPPYPTGGETATGASGTATTDLRGDASDYGINSASSPIAGSNNPGSDVAGDAALSDTAAGSSAIDSSDIGAPNLPDAPAD